MFLDPDGQFEGNAYDFVEWVLTDGQDYVRENGYVLFDDDRLEEAQTKLAEKTGRELNDGGINRLGGF